MPPKPILEWHSRPLHEAFSNLEAVPRFRLRTKQPASLSELAVDLQENRELCTALLDVAQGGAEGGWRGPILPWRQSRLGWADLRPTDFITAAVCAETL